MAWFYEIRNSNNAVLKRDGGFPTQDAAKIAGREDVRKMKNSRQPDRPFGVPAANQDEIYEVDLGGTRFKVGPWNTRRSFRKNDLEPRVGGGGPTFQNGSKCFFKPRRRIRFYESPTGATAPGCFRRLQKVPGIRPLESF
jgi:hypothetical protein